MEFRPPRLPDPWHVARILFVASPFLFLALLLAGCAARVVKETEPARCEVSAAAIAPVPVPAPLPKRATNEDLKNRHDKLEAQLEKCNARLADVPFAVQTLKGKAPEPEKPGFIERLKALFQ